MTVAPLALPSDEGSSQPPVLVLTEHLLAERYAERVYRFAAFFASQGVDPQDVAQEALVRALQWRDRFDPARGDVETWLWAIVVNCARDARRGIARRSALWTRLVSRYRAGLSRTVEDDALALLDNARLLAAVRHLPARPRLALALRFGAGLSFSAVAAAALVVVLGNGIASYYAPSWAHVLAGAPVIGPIAASALNAAGLAAGQVAPVHDSRSADGVSATLDGAYADATRTTLFVSFSGWSQGRPEPGRPWQSFDDATLTDQFGQQYGLTGGVGCCDSAYPMDFAPLRGAAASVGARFTVDIAVRSLTGFVHGEPVLATGHIVLHATVLASSSISLQPPAPVSSQGTSFRIAGLIASNNSISVHTVLSGRLIDQLLARVQQREDVMFPGVCLIDPSGTWLIPFSEGSQPPMSQWLQSQQQDETRVFARTMSGTYRVVVTLDNPGASARILASWDIQLSPS